MPWNLMIRSAKNSCWLPLWINRESQGSVTWQLRFFSEFQFAAFQPETSNLIKRVSIEHFSTSEPAFYSHEHQAIPTESV